MYVGLLIIIVALIIYILYNCYNEYIYNTKVQILQTGSLEKFNNLTERKYPTILTPRPSLGKTEMLISTLSERIKNEEEFNAIVVLRFIFQAKRNWR